MVLLGDLTLHGSENAVQIVLSRGEGGVGVDLVAVDSQRVQLDDLEDFRRNVRHDLGGPILVACLELAVGWEGVKRREKERNGRGEKDGWEGGRERKEKRES